jgi:hypothetical protein
MCCFLCLLQRVLRTEQKLIDHLFKCFPFFCDFQEFMSAFACKLVFCCGPCITIIHWWKRTENFPYIQYKEIQSGAIAKSYMRKGFLIYEEMRKYFPRYEEAVSHIWLCNCSILNFLIYEENLFFFLSVYPFLFHGGTFMKSRFQVNELD